MTESVTTGRPFEHAHPWLTFSFDLRRLGHGDWLALGEAAAMARQIAGTVLAPEVARELHDLYLAKGALATTAIEGNTLSEDEARAVVDGRSRLPPSRQYLEREIGNVVAACKALVEELKEGGRIPLTARRIAEMNAAVLEGLEVEEHVVPGRIRTANVTVGSYRCPDWQDAGYLLARLCEVLDGFDPPPGDEYAFSILKAVFAHLHLAWIHPFGDGNGRTARLMEFAILAQAGLPLPACHLLSNHYNRTRSRYYRQLARASREEGGRYGFAAYAIAGLLEGLREQVERIRGHQWDVAWTNFVHERFRDAGGRVARRRRSLALALARAGGAFGPNELANLDAETARHYARLGRRTLARDVEALRGMGLLATEAAGVRADRERLLAFTPWQNAPGDGG